MSTLRLTEHSITSRDVIHNCDALTLLRGLATGSVDAIITDPPYGLYGNVLVTRPDTGGLYQRVNETWDRFVPLAWLTEAQRVLKPGGSVLCFGGRQSIYAIANAGLSLGWRIVNDITWYKPDATPNFTGRMLTESTERCLWFCPDGTRWTYNHKLAKRINNGKSMRDVWTFGQTRGTRYHPTQKPLELIERMIMLFTQPGALVLDPFVGSGTTALAARNTGRHFICGDISREYVDIARERLAAPYTLPMFDTPASTDPAPDQLALFAR